MITTLIIVGIICVLIAIVAGFFITHLIVVGVIACVLIAMAGIFITRFIARKYWEEDRPVHDRERRTFIIGGGTTGLLIIAMAIIVVITEANLPPCGQIPVTSIASPVCIPGTINIDGSTALQPLVQMIADDYKTKGNCQQTTFNIHGTTSGEGLRYVEDGTNGVVIGDSDVPASAQESDLEDHVVAATIFCVIINNDVSVTNLSTQNLKDIYDGKITNWQKIGGPNEPITVYSRPEDSGTRQTFQQYVLHGPEGVTTAEPIDKTENLIQAVANKSGAIGYADLYDVTRHANQIKIVRIDGVPADTATTIDNSYHFWNLEHMYVKKNNAPALALDLIYYMNSPRGRSIAQSHSYVDIADMTNFPESGHCPP